MGIGEVGESLRRSTVHIRCVDPRRQSAGFWDSDGTVVTNAHVIGRGAYWVQLWDGEGFRAEIKVKGDQRDLAKLKLATSGLPSAKFRGDAVRPGELVVAVGNPLGFTGALTTGVVHAAGPFSGLGRKTWVQAAIRLAPGNSGGPLADAAGQVVRINTMIVAHGIALAIPSAAVADFVQNRASPRPGITVRPVRIDRRNRIGLVILSVDEGSPAAQVSLLIGDLLTGTDNAPFTMTADLADAIAEPGLHLKLRFLRGDRTREREVVFSLGRRFASEAA